jgi:hypothetical protein
MILHVYQITSFDVTHSFRSRHWKKHYKKAGFLATVWIPWPVVGQKVAKIEPLLRRSERVFNRQKWTPLREMWPRGFFETPCIYRTRFCVGIESEHSPFQISHVGYDFTPPDVLSSNQFTQKLSIFIFTSTAPRKLKAVIILKYHFPRFFAYSIHVVISRHTKFCRKKLLHKTFKTSYHRKNLDENPKNFSVRVFSFEPPCILNIHTSAQRKKWSRDNRLAWIFCESPWSADNTSIFVFDSCLELFYNSSMCMNPTAKKPLSRNYVICVDFRDFD